jgi:DNA end-binding protein Ku
MRAIWSGAIGFGLVNIPVRIFSATESSSLDLTMLDKKDHSTIKYVRVNKETGKEVAWADIVKGYKYDGEYVVLGDEDFEKASPKKSKTIEIQEFVQQEEIDPMYFDTPYYLEPAKGGERAYALLREALVKSGRMAVGTFVMRTKENLAVLRPVDDMLVLIKLRFAEEIRDYSELNIPTGKNIEVKPAEVKMAMALIDQLTPKEFDITKYKDTYDQELMKMIEAKATGKKITAPKTKKTASKSIDLMAQLKESLNTGHGRHKKAS